LWVPHFHNSDIQVQYDQAERERGLLYRQRSVLGGQNGMGNVFGVMINAITEQINNRTQTMRNLRDENPSDRTWRGRQVRRGA
jgi:hypothetical protein